MSVFWQVFGSRVGGGEVGNHSGVQLHCLCWQCNELASQVIQEAQCSHSHSCALCIHALPPIGLELYYFGKWSKCFWCAWLTFKIMSTYLVTHNLMTPLSHTALVAEEFWGHRACGWGCNEPWSLVLHTEWVSIGLINFWALFILMLMGYHGI